MKGFVSGLPDDRARPAAPDPRGLVLLERIKAYGTSTAAVLEPLCTRRFDGDEWLQPDPADCEAKADCETLVRLVDLILADKQLCALVAARLARGERR